jgi:hypothetical protein
MSEVWGGALLPVILTGMGQDGLRGSHILKAQGASVIARDEASSVVWGKPGAVVGAGLVSQIIPLDRIAQAIRSSANTFRFRPWERLSLIALSILIGTAMHIFWDAFTHPDSWIYRHWAFLRGSFELPVIGEIQAYKLLEYVRCIFGVAVLAVWIWG